MRLDEKVQERFWAKVAKSDGCWDWTACTLNGYGRFGVRGRVMLAHRVSWLIAGKRLKPASSGYEIDHRCLNKSCVNVAHLREVTKKQNAENVAGARSHSKSGVRGVYWIKSHSKWRVVVHHGGKNYYGGHYPDLEDAARAARAKRNELFTHNEGDK